LTEIHKRKLVHHDFHLGNILNKKVDTWKNRYPCCITDLGLCRPAGEIGKGKIYGVLPYVAPEVLCSKYYTQASDIYSLGIVTYEILSGLPPYIIYDEKEKIYSELPHDVDLAFKICKGLRPNLSIVQVPQLLKDLISKCWDANPENRPKARELIKIERD
jgi:serine/threonine protein kinase